MTNHFYQKDLTVFRELAARFSLANPSIASLLEKSSKDPDVERLIEAVVYQNTMLRRMRDAGLPDLINDLTNLVLPHFSQLIPGCTIVAFTPQAECTEITQISSGALIRTSPIDGTPCRFTIKNDLQIHPLKLTGAKYSRQPGQNGNTIRLSLALTGTTLNCWHPKELRIFLNADRSTACELYRLLDKHVTRITLTPLQGGTAIELSPGHLKPAGFDEDEAFLPYPSQSFPGYQLLLEYFNIPEKFLTFALTGWDQWLDCGEGASFTIDFELSDTPSSMPKIRPENFVLNSTVAVNIFKHQADPVIITHRPEKYRLRPAGSNQDHYRILTVDSVTGCQHNTNRQRSYLPFDLFAGPAATPVYNVVQQKSQHGPGLETWLSVAYPGDMPEAGTETVSIDLTATNGNLTESIRIGDLCIPESGIPGSVTFCNITPVTHTLLPPTGIDRLELFNTRIILNQLPLDTDNMKTQLRQLVYSDQCSGSAMAANLKRIDGIESMTITPGEKYVAGLAMKGSEISIKIRQDHFAGAGDLHLFCCILDHFLGSCHATNSYTRLTINETTLGTTSQWPMRLGSCNQKELVFTPEKFPATGASANLTVNTETDPPETGANAAILDDLVANGREYGFFQALRLVRNAVASQDTQEEQEEQSDTAWLERVRVIGDMSLGFPAADISGIKQLADNLLQITATFGSLYGVSSPLPTHYTESLIEEASEDSSVTRDFLDIYNRGWYIFLYFIWCSRHLLIKIAEEKNQPYLQKLFSLIGLAENRLRDSVPDSLSYLRYSGILNQSNSTASGLQAILRDSFGINCISIEQCVQRRVKIPEDQQCRLGYGRLGIDTVLGSEVTDRNGKFRVHIGPLKKKLHDTFLPTGPNHSKLIRLIRMYEKNPFQYDLKLTLAAGEARPIVLGDPNGNGLGWGTVCFSGPTFGEVSSIYQLSEWPQEPQPEEQEPYYALEPDEPKTLVDYYQEETGGLGDKTDDFVQLHSGMAAMVSGHATDPSIERLTQGTAFSNALLRQEMDDDLPEVIHTVTEALHPWNLRPIPATTIVAFTPKPELKQPVLIPAGAEVASKPVQGTNCRFRTCADVIVHPMTLLEAAFSQPPGKHPSIILQCELNGIKLSGWKPNSIRFFLGDDFPAACELYLLLTRYLKQVIISSPDNGANILIPSDRLKPLGFGDDENMLAKEVSFMPGHLLLQEYFLFHDKYLFLEMGGLDKCSNLGDGSHLEINFELTNCPFAIPKVTAKSFVLSATPVINLFPHKAKPITFITDLKQQAISPDAEHPDHFQIYSVDQVEGKLKTKSSEIVYNVQKHLLKRSKDSHPCHITRIKSPIGEGFDTFISISSHDQKTVNQRIKLDIDLTCTNGILPEQLNIGDICIATKPALESVVLGNIKTITPTVFQNSQTNRQWKLLSGFSLNCNTSLKLAENLRAILRLYIPANSRNQISVRADMMRVNSIIAIDTKTTDRLIGCRMYRGYDVKIKLRGDHFTDETVARCAY